MKEFLKGIKERLVDIYCRNDRIWEICQAIREDYGTDEVLKYCRWRGSHKRMSYTLYRAFCSCYFDNFLGPPDLGRIGIAEGFVMFSIYRAIKYGDSLFVTLGRLADDGMAEMLAGML